MTSTLKYNKVFKLIIKYSSLEYCIDDREFEKKLNLIAQEIGTLFGYEYCNIGFLQSKSFLVDCGIFVEKKLSVRGRRIIVDNKKRFFDETLVGRSINEIDKIDDYFYGEFSSKNTFNKSNQELPLSFKELDFNLIIRFEKEILLSQRIINYLVYPIYDDDDELAGYLNLINKKDESRITKSEAEQHIQLSKLIFSLFKNKNFHKNLYQDDITMNRLYTNNDIDTLLSKILKYLAKEFDVVTSSFFMKADNGFDNESQIVFLRAIEYGNNIYKNKYQDKINHHSESNFSGSLSGRVISNNLKEGDNDHSKIRFFDLIQDQVKIMWDFVEESKYIITIPIMKSVINLGNINPKPENNIWGVICLQTIDDLKNDINKSRLTVIATHIGVNIEKAIYMTRYNQVNTLNQNMKFLEPESVNHGLYDELVRIIKKVSHSESCSIFFPDDDGKYLYLKATTASEATSFLDQQRLPLNVEDLIKRRQKLYSIGENEDSGITGRVFYRREAVIIYDISKRKDIHHSFFEKNKNSHKSMVVTTIKGSQGKVIGIIRCINKKKKQKIQSVFTSGDLEIINLVISLATNAILNKEFLEKQYMAMTHFAHESRIPLQALSDELSILKFLIKRNGSNLLPNDIFKTFENIKLSQETLLHNIMNAEYVFIKNRAKNKFTNIQMNDLIKRVQRGFSNYKIRIYTSEAPEIEGDESQLTRVFYNLVLNAIRYSPSNPEIRIEYKLSDNYKYPNWHQFIVSNFGIGIGESETELIFQTFYRTDRAKRKYPTGTGIGLKICRDIMEQHEGFIKVTKNDNPTKFSLFFKP